jgi:hypothetical protein
MLMTLAEMIARMRDSKPKVHYVQEEWGGFPYVWPNEHREYTEFVLKHITPLLDALEEAADIMDGELKYHAREGEPLHENMKAFLARYHGQTGGEE